MLNQEESEAFNELQKRVNDLTERVEIVETAGRSLFDILPYFIRKHLAEWAFPKYLEPLKLIFDSTPERTTKWETDERLTKKPTPNRITGYHRNGPETGSGQDEFREIS